MTVQKHKEILAKIAKKYGVSIDDVERDIAIALNSTTKKDAQPTQKNAIAHLANKAKKQL